MELLSHPFRLTANGAVATVTDDTDQAAAEGLAILAMTRKGERVMAPEFGLTDPAFDAVSVAELNVGLNDYGPGGVSVSGIQVTYPTDSTQRVELTFDTTTDEQE